MANDLNMQNNRTELKLKHCLLIAILKISNGCAVCVTRFFVEISLFVYFVENEFKANSIFNGPSPEAIHCIIFHVCRVTDVALFVWSNVTVVDNLINSTKSFKAW